MKILFVCKYNRFRSQFAEKYFRRINKNLKVSSAGIIKVDKPLTLGEKKRKNYVKKKFEINLTPKSRGIKVSLLENQDKIIVIANDIPKSVFNHPNWKNKIIIWNIPDELGANKEKINKIVSFIMKKVDNLVKSLENRK